MTVAFAYFPGPTAVTADFYPPAIVESLDPRTRSTSVLLAEPSTSGLLREGMKHIQAFALLPIDPDGDAAFAAFSRTLVKAIPRSVIIKR